MWTQECSQGASAEGVNDILGGATMVLIFFLIGFFKWNLMSKEGSIVLQSHLGCAVEGGQILPGGLTILYFIN